MGLLKVTGTIAISQFFGTGTSDALYLTDDFLKKGSAAKKMKPTDFLDAKGNFTKEPEELVFAEATSKIVGPNGKPVLGW